MTSFRAEPRSSNSSIGIEHAETVEELREMTISEALYSPQQQPSDPALLREMVSHHSAASSPVSRSSRGNWHGELLRREERVGVFKDKVPCDAKSQTLKSKQNNLTSKRALDLPIRKKASASLHARSKSDSAVVQTQFPCKAFPGSSPATGSPYQARGMETTLVCSEFRTLVSELERIAAERSELTSLLEALCQREKCVLAELGRGLMPVDLHRASHSSKENDVENLPTPLTTSTLSRTSMLLGDTIPQTTYPLSAPSKPIPLSRRNRTPNASRRIPLAEKTQASLVTCDYLPSYMRGNTALRDKDSAWQMKVGRGVSVQVPTKFGDNEEMENNERKYIETTPATKRDRRRAERSRKL